MHLPCVSKVRRRRRASKKRKKNNFTFYFIKIRYKNIQVRILSSERNVIDALLYEGNIRTNTRKKFPRIPHLRYLFTNKMKHENFCVNECHKAPIRTHKQYENINKLKIDWPESTPILLWYVVIKLLPLDKHTRDSLLFPFKKKEAHTLIWRCCWFSDDTCLACTIFLQLK